EKHDVTFTFSPTQSQSYVAFTRMKAASHCAEQTVTLLGSGVPSTLDCTALDFGFLPPGLTLSRTATVTNYSLQDVTVTALTATAPDFAPEVAMLTVPAAKRGTGASLSLTPGTATLGIDFKPTKLNALSATVAGSSTLAAQPTLVCAVK